MRSNLMALLIALLAVATLRSAAFAGSGSGHDARCTDPATGQPVDCVPATFTTFDIPFAKLPGGRMDAQGNLDPTSSPKDAHAGAFVAAKKLGLFLLSASRHAAAVSFASAGRITTIRGIARRDIMCSIG